MTSLEYIICVYSILVLYDVITISNMCIYYTCCLWRHYYI